MSKTADELVTLLEQRMRLIGEQLGHPHSRRGGMFMIILADRSRYTGKTLLSALRKAAVMPRKAIKPEETGRT